MTYRNLIIPLAFAVSTVGCGSSADSASTQAGTCLQQHTGKLDTLLTKQDIAPYAENATEEMETDYDKEYAHEISYSWPSDRTRTMEVSGNEFTIPMSNIISLGGIKTYTERDYYDRDENDPVKRFQRAHHNLTAEEKAKARAAIKKEMQNKGETAGKLADSIMGATSSKNTFKPVAGVGDAAVWDRQAKRLVVLTGETEFRVHVGVSDETEKNQAVAKKVAQSILADCAGGT